MVSNEQSQVLKYGLLPIPPTLPSRLSLRVRPLTAQSGVLNQQESEQCGTGGFVTRTPTGHCLTGGCSSVTGEEALDKGDESERVWTAVLINTSEWQVDKRLVRAHHRPFMA